MYVHKFLIPCYIMIHEKVIPNHAIMKIKKNHLQ